MTEISAPWNGVITGDASLAPYNSAEWFQIWWDITHASKVNEGPIMGTGVSPDPGLTVTQTTPASASINVSIGSALVRGGWYRSDATVNLPVGPNATGNPRIDTVVLRKNYVTQETRLVLKPGTAAVTPVPPSLNQVDLSLWEIPLADIAVANGFATITNANISPRRHWAGMADGVYLEDIFNNSGGVLETGDVVIWDTTTGRSVTTTTTVGNALAAGVWVGRTEAGGYGRMLVKGIGLVKIQGAISQYQAFESSATAKRGVYAALSTLNAVGMMLETLGGTGLGTAYIDVRPHRSPQVVSAASVFSNTTTNLTFTLSHATHVVIITPRTPTVRVTIQCIGSVQDGTKVGYYDIYSVTLAARAGGVYGLQIVSGSSAPAVSPVTMVGIFTGLAPYVAQEFQLHYKTSDAGSYVQVAGPVTLYAEEV